MKLERVQKTCLKVILGDMYVSYEAALEMSGLESLFIRRTKRCLNFSLKCLKYPKTSKLFPVNPVPVQNMRKNEKFHVNFARTSKYQNSAIPFCQKLLNEHYRRQNKNWFNSFLFIVNYDQQWFITILSIKTIIIIIIKYQPSCERDTCSSSAKSKMATSWTK